MTGYLYIVIVPTKADVALALALSNTLSVPSYRASSQDFDLYTTPQYRDSPRLTPSSSANSRPASSPPSRPSESSLFLGINSKKKEKRISNTDRRILSCLSNTAPSQSRPESEADGCKHKTECGDEQTKTTLSYDPPTSNSPPRQSVCNFFLYLFFFMKRLNCLIFNQHIVCLFKQHIIICCMLGKRKVSGTIEF